MTRQVLRFDEQVGVRMMPNVQTRDRGQSGAPYLVRTNAAGFRTRDVPLKPAAGTRRVLVYGDSFTEAVGVSDGQRFTDILEDLLPHTEVLNYGVRATGTDQQFLLFRERPQELEYDLILLGLYTGDVLRSHSKYGVLTSPTGAHYEKPYFTLEGGKLTLQNVPVPRTPAEYGQLAKDERQLYYRRGLGYRMRSLIRRHAPWAKTTLQRLTRFQPAPYLKSADHPAWVITRAIVEQWSREAVVPMLVLPIPPYQYMERTASPAAYRARFAELGEIDEVTVHDPLDDMIATHRRGDHGELRIRGDAHYSAQGHRVIAESVAPTIAELLESTKTQTGTVMG